MTRLRLAGLAAGVGVLAAAVALLAVETPTGGGVPDPVPACQQAVATAIPGARLAGTGPVEPTGDVRVTVRGLAEIPGMAQAGTPTAPDRTVAWVCTASWDGRRWGAVVDTARPGGSAAVPAMRRTCCGE